MRGSEGTPRLISIDAIPVRRRFIVARPVGECLVVRRRLTRKGFRLNKSAEAVWSLCDGQTPVAEIIEKLERTFEKADGALAPDVMTTLIGFKENGLLKFKNTPRNERGARRIDIRHIPFYVINCNQHTTKRDRMQRQLEELGLKFEFARGIVSDEAHFVGCTLSHLRILNRREIETPFVILEDDCLFNEHFRYEFTVPNDTDAFYLGVSRCRAK